MLGGGGGAGGCVEAGPGVLCVGRRLFGGELGCDLAASAT